MPWIAAAGAIGGALISSSASGDAADTQANSAAQASAVEQSQFNQNKADLAPWVSSGNLALGDLNKFLGIGLPTGVGGNSTAPGVASFNPNLQQLSQTPGYQFQLQQGLGGVLNSASALGGVNSGNTLKALNNYAQGAASTEYQNAFSNWNTTLNNIFARLSGQSGTGANAAGQTAGLGANTASQVGSNLIGAGNAQAAGTVGSANALNSGIGTLSNNYLLQSILNNQNNGGGSGGFTQSSSSGDAYYQP